MLEKYILFNKKKTDITDCNARIMLSVINNLLHALLKNLFTINVFYLTFLQP